MGLDRLATVLGEQRGSSPDRSCARIVAALASDEVRDDATLLVVRTRALGARQVATWELPPDPALVARARSMAAEQLGRWGLDDLVFTTEVVVSELVTNAIRHAFGLIGLRLIRDRSLICEVSDSQHTSPHARYAGSDEEGGRGLFMVAQLTEHWGTRYTAGGQDDLGGTGPAPGVTAARRPRGWPGSRCRSPRPWLMARARVPPRRRCRRRGCLCCDGGGRGAGP